MLRIGYNEPFCGKMTSMISDCKNRVMQFCLGSPLSFQRSRVDPTDLENAKKLAKKNGVLVYSHAPYYWSLCGSVKKLDRPTSGLFRELKYELGVLSHFRTENGGGGVVIHPGSHADEQGCLNEMIKTLQRVEFPPNSLLLLENSAGQGTTKPTNLLQLAYIMKHFPGTENIGICLDTAHLHGVGEYDLSKISDIDRLKADFIKYNLWKHLKLIHLNDSKVELGAKKDRHEHPGDGVIWRENKDALNHFMHTFDEFPMIVEMCVVDFDRIKSYYH